MASQRTAVYRLFCPEGRLVYIGRSASPESRIALHRRCTHGWQSELGDAVIEWYPNPTAARRAARAATLAERPENVDPLLDLTPDPAPAAAILAENPKLNRMRGKNGPGSELLPAIKRLYMLKREVRERLDTGEISVVQALDILCAHPQMNAHRAGDFLGLDVGGKQGWRRVRTVDHVLELNGIAR